MLKYLSPVHLTHQHISQKKNEFNFKLIAGLLIVSSDRYSPMPVKRLVCEFTWWIVNDRQRGSDLSRTLSYGAIRVLSTLRALPSPTVTLFIKRSLLFYHTMGNYITRSKHNSRWLQLRTRQNEWINANLGFFLSLSLFYCSFGFHCFNAYQIRDFHSKATRAYFSPSQHRSREYRGRAF